MAEKGSEGEGRNTIQILSSNMCENLNQEITLHFLGKKMYSSKIMNLKIRKVLSHSRRRPEYKCALTPGLKSFMSYNTNMIPTMRNIDGAATHPTRKPDTFHNCILLPVGAIHNVSSKGQPEKSPFKNASTTCHNTRVPLSFSSPVN